MQPFHILRLPAVALCEVLKNLNPFELFELSQCSRKAFAVVSLGGTKKFKIVLCLHFCTVQINEKYSFVSHCLADKEECEISGVRKFDRKEVLISYRSPTWISSFFEDKFTGVCSLYNYLTSLFKCRTHCIATGSSVPRGITMSCINILLSRQSDIEKLVVRAHSVTDEDLDYILNKLKVTIDLVILPGISESYQISTNFSSMSLHFHDAAYITSSNILNMTETSVIKLYNTFLTNKDIETIFQHWISGKLPKLEYLHIDGKRMGEDIKIGKLETLYSGKTDFFTKRTIEGGGITGAVPIRRDDGVSALVRLYPAEYYRNSPVTIELLVIFNDPVWVNGTLYIVPTV